MSAARERMADQMARDIHEYLARTLPAGIGGREDAWERTAPASDALMAAFAAWDRGELTYAELEEAGVRFVEAWGEAGAG